MTEVFSELSHPFSGYFLYVDPIYKKKSEFQEVVVAEHPDFGKCLFLDGVIQFSEKDEFLYHEALIQPAMHILKNPKKALILGGGDGLAAREFLKHDSIEKVVLVDIDEEVVETSKKYFSDLTNNVFENPKLEVNIQDAFKYIKETKEKFDVIVMDLTDPGHPIGKTFYCDDFFKLCKNIMSENSIFVTHGSSYSISFPTAARVYADFKKSFKNSDLYKSDHIDSFNTPIGFLMGYDSNFEIDFDIIEKNYSKSKDKLRYYSPGAHKQMFYKPKWLKNLIKKSEPLPEGYTEVCGSKFFKKEEFPM